MAVTFERTIAGEVAYLTVRRDGPVLMWEKGLPVKFAFNRPGSSFTRVEEPSRFGGTPKSSAQFRTFARRFADQGESVGLGRRRDDEFSRGLPSHNPGGLLRRSRRPRYRRR